jgi:Asp-tRNA(Asn)/Glu-tRNA(Gln) amidotransferase C subunit
MNLRIKGEREMLKDWMKNRKNIFTTLTIAGGVLVSSIFIGYSTGSPGSISDPAITKSYLDSQTDLLKKEIQDIKKQLEAIEKQQNLQQLEELKNMEQEISSLKNQVKELLDLKGKVDNLEKLNPANFMPTFEVIELKDGDRIIAGASTEIILRSGRARAISSVAGGLINVTSESQGNLVSPSDVPLNHLLIIPRADGRGIRITSENAWVMIKGNYEIR